MGQRGRGARARFPRHLPRRGLFASRRQHSAAPGGGAAMRPLRRGLIRGLAAAYEIQVDLVEGICLHEHKIDHIAHLGPAAAAGIGAMLWSADRDDLSGGTAGAACHHHHAAIAQGRDFQLEGLCPGVCRQDGDRSRRSRDARRRRAVADLRGRGRRHRLAARWPEGRVQRAAAGAGRTQARHPRDLHQGALRRISEPGADRPRPPDGAEDRRPRPGARASSSTPAITRIT